MPPQAREKLVSMAADHEADEPAHRIFDRLDAKYLHTLPDEENDKTFDAFAKIRNRKSPPGQHRVAGAWRTKRLIEMSFHITGGRTWIHARK